MLKTIYRKSNPSALERQVRFLFEQRTETYMKYGEGAAQKKIVPGAKNVPARRALPGLPERGAEGLVAIVVVTMIIIVLSLMSIGFARIMDRGLRQSTDRELASQASYAAEAGLNDARAYVAKAAENNNLDAADTDGRCLDLDPAPAPFVKNGSLSGDHNNIATDNLVRYTCVIIDTKPSELVYSLKAGESKVFKVIPDSGDVDNLYFGWTRPGTEGSPQPIAATPHQLPTEAAFGSGQTGILRTTIYPVPSNINSETNTNSRLTQLSRDYFMYANGAFAGGNIGTVNYNNNATFVNGECHSNNLNDSPMPAENGTINRYCNSRVSNLPLSGASKPKADFCWKNSIADPACGSMQCLDANLIPGTLSGYLCSPDYDQLGLCLTMSVGNPCAGPGVTCIPSGLIGFTAFFCSSVYDLNNGDLTIENNDRSDMDCIRMYPSQPLLMNWLCEPKNLGSSGSFYYVKITALYSALNVSIQASNASDNSIKFREAEAVIDVTGQGNDVLKRVQARVNLEPKYDIPIFALQSMDTLCKRLRLPKEWSDTDPAHPNPYGSAIIDDDADAKLVDGAACKP